MHVHADSRKVIKSSLPNTFSSNWPIYNLPSLHTCILFNPTTYARILSQNGQKRKPNPLNIAEPPPFLPTGPADG